MNVILHQAIWTISSFFIFYILMNLFVFKKLNKNFKIRKSAFENMENETKNAIEQVEKLKKEMFFIENIELPNKFENYVRVNAEAVKQDLELKIQSYKEDMQEILAKEEKIQVENSKIKQLAKEIIERFE